MNKIDERITANLKAFQKEIDYYIQRYDEGVMSKQQALEFISEGEEHMHGRIQEYSRDNLKRGLNHQLSDLIFLARQHFEGDKKARQLLQEATQ